MIEQVLMIVDQAYNRKILAWYNEKNWKAAVARRQWKQRNHRLTPFILLMPHT